METYIFNDIWLTKDGEPCICPLNPGILRPNESVVSSGSRPPQLFIDRLICNKTCPFMKGAEQKNNVTGETRTGVALTCGLQVTFLQVYENKTTKKLDIK
jgi:hypothetical protein